MIERDSLGNRWRPGAYHRFWDTERYYNLLNEVFHPLRNELVEKRPRRRPVRHWWYREQRRKRFDAIAGWGHKRGGQIPSSFILGLDKVLI